jgi:lipopolysaccharide export system protein LptA
MQIFVGNVSFHHDGVMLYCDSANFFQNTNSFEAFGKVRMLQGDTLSLRSKYLYYDGNAQIAQARQEVVLRHQKTTLYTDSLNYDRIYSEGYFFEGGKLVDDGNVLTSDWGQYETNTRQALFNYNVKLVNDEYVITSDTLHYNTFTKLAHLTGPSNIVSGDSHIYTERSDFNTTTNQAVLLDRSVLVDKDKQMVGDSVVYDKHTGISQAFNNIIFNDKTNKNIFTGDYFYYNDSTGFAKAYGRAQVKNYSEADTLFLHADTFKVYTYNLRTDSVYRILHGYYHSRSYREDIQSVADSLSYNSREKTLFLYGNPIVWSDQRQILGEEIRAFFNDSTMDSVHVLRQALMVEKLDSAHYNQVAGNEMKVYFDGKNIKENRVVGNVLIIYFPYDKDSTMTGMNYSETSILRMFMENKKMKRIWTREITGTFYPLDVVEKPKMFLSQFAWFDYMRPKDKYDIFNWQAKTAGTELKKTVRRNVPLQKLDKIR